MARRKELGNPLGEVAEPPALPRQPHRSPAVVAGEAQDLVLELGCEELPPDDVDSAVQQLRAALPGVRLTSLPHIDVCSHLAAQEHSGPRAGAG